MDTRSISVFLVAIQAGKERRSWGLMTENVLGQSAVWRQTEGTATRRTRKCSKRWLPQGRRGSSLQLDSQEKAGGPIRQMAHGTREPGHASWDHPELRYPVSDSQDCPQAGAEADPDKAARKEAEVKSGSLGPKRQKPCLQDKSGTQRAAVGLPSTAQQGNW